ncbi:PhoH-like protein [Oligella ureolytica]|uniref:PhoH-like protein n=1 Tax=Oligella ureolytica TaxID=90244 RepID=A0A378XIB3_9BURK|nr:PhoH family protein [Oligella ureolytica]QPT39588.1 PhoH family protein [Oligella ureolytica]SUA56806.1 PhoH-like protein [Oligella ureolytica]
MTNERKLPQVIHLEGDNTQLANLCGPLDENLEQIAQAWGVKIGRHGSRFTIEGNETEEAIHALMVFHRRARHTELTIDDIQLGIVELKSQREDKPQRTIDTGENSSRSVASTKKSSENLANYGFQTPAEQLKAYKELAQEANEDAIDLDEAHPTFNLRVRRTNLRPRTPRQRQYLEQILNADITFGVGPAGTGKTWLAVACAIDALERDNVQRIILTRPAVEAGERLGFLPGDLAQKVDPYLRPLYDALYDLMGFEKVQKLFEKQTIEIAPLAYMRGRTLNHAFVILDEAQNTTPEQMKMFLTRIGFGSKAVITGDPSQVDLPKGQFSGLMHSLNILKSVDGIKTTIFNSKDVVRHPLVARIIEAYESVDGSNY